MFGYKFLLISFIAFSFSACVAPVVETPVQPLLQRPPLADINVDVIGMGAVTHTFPTPAQDLLMAKRAAIVDGYRLIGERIYGVKVNAKETIKDMAAKSSNVNTCVNSIIKNAKVESVTCKDEVCQASMNAVLDGVTLREIFPWKD